MRWFRERTPTRLLPLPDSGLSEELRFLVPLETEMRADGPVGVLEGAQQRAGLGAGWRSVPRALAARHQRFLRLWAVPSFPLRRMEVLRADKR